MREAGLVAGLFFCYLDCVVYLGFAAFQGGEEELPCPLRRAPSTATPVSNRVPARAATN